MPKAVKVTEVNVDDLISIAEFRSNLDLSSYLRDMLEDAAEEGQDLYLIFDPDQWSARTITECYSRDFVNMWEFVDGEMDEHFNEIVKKGGE